MTVEIRNPVIPGFYSDPSICSNRGNYFLVASSFGYFPGIPLFYSRDLVNWRQISHVLSRPSQLNLAECEISDGIYASTIRYYDGRYYVITSNRLPGSGNHFIVYTDNIEGDWSDPVWIKSEKGLPIEGVDPSLFFDYDGKVYFTCVANDENGQGIGQAEIDIETGELGAPLKIIWRGSGDTFPEGPHTYRINNKYYLLIAEGGTEYGHKVTIARSDSIWGPYCGCPRNPILTQKRIQSQSSRIQGVGHGDLIESQEGKWWLVIHGFRTSIGKLHHLGRETMLCPVEWNDDGWPVANSKGWLDEIIHTEASFLNSNTPDIFSKISIERKRMLPFAYINNPVKEKYSIDSQTGVITLIGGDKSLDEIGHPSWIGRRQQHFKCLAEVKLDFIPEKEGQMAGFGVFQTNEHHYEIVVGLIEGIRTVYLRKKVGDILVELGHIQVNQSQLSLRIQANELLYTFFVECEDASHQIGTGRTQLISTEAMQQQNFTGTFIGMFAFSKDNFSPPAKFSNFRYIPYELENLLNDGLTHKT